MPFSFVVLLYVLILRNIDRSNNVKVSVALKKDEMELYGHKSSKPWQKSSQSTSLHPLSNVFKSKMGEETENHGTSHHLVQEKSAEMTHRKSKQATGKPSETAQAKQASSGPADSRHAWKKETHKK